MAHDTPTRDIAMARECLAVDLEIAIADVGRSLRAYERETATLSERTGVDLAPAVEPIIVRHLAKAGLTRFLERKLVDAPASLLTVVEDQHRHLLGAEPSAARRSEP